MEHPEVAGEIRLEVDWQEIELLAALLHEEAAGSGNPIAFGLLLKLDPAIDEMMFEAQGRERAPVALSATPSKISRSLTSTSSKRK